jgi:hypothetical protein
MTHGFLAGDHDVAVGPGTAPRMARFTAAGETAVAEVRAALGLPALRRRAVSAAATEVEQD